MKLGVCRNVGPAGRYGLFSARRFRRLGPRFRWSRYSFTCTRTTRTYARIKPVEKPAARPKPTLAPPKPWPTENRRFPVPTNRKAGKR